MISRSYRVRIHQRGTTTPSSATVALTLGLQYLTDPPALPSPIVRPLEGRTESVSWVLPVVDLDGILTERLGDPATGRTWLIGRVVEVQVRDDGGAWRTAGTGRLVDLSEPDGPGQYTLQVEDERWLERRATIFGATQTAQVHPFGLASPFGKGSWGRPAAGFDQMEIVERVGDAVKIRTGGTTTTPREVGTALLGDMVDPGDQSMAAGHSQGNFRSLRLHVTGVDGSSVDHSLRVIALSGGSLGGTPTPQRILGPLWPGHSGLPDRPDTLPGVSYIWVHWPVASVGSELTARLHTPGKGIATSEALPLHIGGESGIHLGALVLQILDGVYGGSPLRISAASRAAISAADLPRVWLRQTKPANRAEWLERNVYALFLILPLVDPQDGLKLLQLWAPEGLDPDTLPLLTASNAAGMRWQNTGHEIRNRVAVEWTALATDPDGPVIDRLKPTDWPTAEDYDNQTQVGVHEFTLSTDLIVEPGEQAARTRWLASEIFAVHGDGPILRDGECDSLGLDLSPGDLVRLDCESLHVPNPATQDRTAQRVARVVRVAELPTHYEIQLLDFGPALQPLPAPSVTIAQDTNDPDRWAVTIAGLGPDDTATVEIAWAPSTTRPAEGAWEQGDAGLENGVHYFRRSASGGYAHARAKAMRANRLPSPWAYARTALATRALIDRAELTLESGAPWVRGSANASTLGIRVRYAVHPIGAEPETLDQTEDFSATGFAAGLTLSATVQPGEQLTGYIEGWTGYSGGSVTGTAGPRVEISAQRAREPLLSERPTAMIELDTETEGTETLRFSGAIGEGGRTPLEYRYAVEGASTWTTYAPMPEGEVVTDGQAGRPAPIARGERTRTVLLQVRDGLGRESQVASYALSSEPTIVDPTPALSILQTRWVYGGHGPGAEPDDRLLELELEYIPDRVNSIELIITPEQNPAPWPPVQTTYRRSLAGLDGHLWERVMEDDGAGSPTTTPLVWHAGYPVDSLVRVHGYDASDSLIVRRIITVSDEGMAVPGGGTGRSQLPAGQLLVGAGTDPVLSLAGSGAGELVKWDEVGQAWMSDPLVLQDLPALPANSLMGRLSGSGRPEAISISSLPFDDYANWRISAGGGSAVEVGSGELLTVTGDGAVSVSLGDSQGGPVLEISAPQAPTTLAGLSDTAIGSPSDEQILMRVGGAWANVDQSELSLAASQIGSGRFGFARLPQVASGTLMGRTASGSGSASAISISSLPFDDYGGWQLAVGASASGDAVGSSETVRIIGGTGVDVSRTATRELTISLSGGVAPTTLAGLDDTAIGTVSEGQVLQVGPGDVWVNRTLAQAGIAASDHTHALTSTAITGRLPLAKFPQVASGTLLGRTASGTGNVSAISITSLPFDDYGGWELRDGDEASGESIGSGQAVEFKGSGAAQVSRTGRSITIDVPAAAAYSWSVGADEGQNRQVLSTDTLTFVGSGPITTEVRDGAPGHEVGISISEQWLNGRYLALGGGTLAGDVYTDYSDWAFGGGTRTAPSYLQASQTTVPQQGGYGLWLAWNAHKVSDTEWVVGRADLPRIYRAGVSFHDEGFALYSGQAGPAGVVEWTRFFRATPDNAYVNGSPVWHSGNFNPANLPFDDYGGWQLAIGGEASGDPVGSSETVRIIGGTGVDVDRTASRELTISLSGGIAPTTLAGLDDTAIGTVSEGQVLQVGPGDVWVNRTLAQAGIAASDHTHALDSTRITGRLPLTKFPQVASGTLLGRTASGAGNVSAISIANLPFDDYSHWLLEAPTGPPLEVGSGESLRVVGKGAASIEIKTDALGSYLEIDVPAAAAYSWWAGADQGQNRQILSGEPVTFTGGPGISTEVRNAAPGHEVEIGVEFGTGSNQVPRGNHEHSYTVSAGQNAFSESTLSTELPSGLTTWQINEALGQHGFPWAYGQILSVGAITPGGSGQAGLQIYSPWDRGSNHNMGRLAYRTSGAYGEWLSWRTIADTDWVDDNYVPLTRSISTGAGLTGGGDLSRDRTLSVDTGWLVSSLPFDDYSYWKLGASNGSSNIESGETAMFTGSGAATVTAGDKSINIHVPVAAAYSWWAGADQGQNRQILSGEPVIFTGGPGISTEVRNAAPGHEVEIGLDTGWLDGRYAPIQHGHSWGEISGKPATATRWPSWSEVASKPSTFPPSSHTHSYTVSAGQNAFSESTLSTELPSGLTTWQINSSSAPHGFPWPYGQILAMGAITPSGTGQAGLQIYIPWSRGSSHNMGRLAYRTSGTYGEWLSWRTIADTDWVDDNYVPLTRSISTGAGLTGGGDLSRDRTLSVDTGWLVSSLPFDDYSYWKLGASNGSSNIESGETAMFTGSGAATVTAGDKSINIHVPVAAAYSWWAGADQGQNRQILSGEPVIFTGGPGISTEVRNAAPGHEVEIGVLFGSGSNEVARGSHNHDGRYLRLSGVSSQTIQGNISVTNITATRFIKSSSRRWKKGIQDWQLDRAALRSLRPVEYDLVEELGSGRDYGLIAEEVPEWAATEDRDGIEYDRITTQLVAGWQAHDTELEELRREVAELRHRRAAQEG